MIVARHYTYSDIDGDHWPDTPLGSALYYSLDYFPWSQCENDLVVDVDWGIPEGIEATDDFLENGKAFIKLTPLKRGSFKIVANIHSKEGSKTQTKTVNMVLRVY